jgi:hypothetical protein
METIKKRREDGKNRKKQQTGRDTNIKQLTTTVLPHHWMALEERRTERYMPTFTSPPKLALIPEENKKRKDESNSEGSERRKESNQKLRSERQETGQRRRV